MRRFPNLNGKSLALMFIGTLAVSLVIALGGLNGKRTGQLVQAFDSPIKKPTPYPTPRPRPSPTPQTVSPQLLEIEAEIELRKSIGFRSDIEHVKAVRSSDDVIIKQEFGGMAFTPDEAREFEVRNS